MEIYLVGGAVRDALLGLPVTEKDYVVVGATPEAMLAQGYKPVGKEFPVFLHPKTHEEYALARTERKTGKGYKGFVFYAAPEVTLEEDLKRRDLTINAMAQTADGHIIDPFQGQTDLKNKILRHVSPAFAEDPVRILRVARFACRFVDFTLHPDTLHLMQQMVAEKEVDALVAERVWQEWHKALLQLQPARFVEFLQLCGAWQILFPELASEDAIITLQKSVELTAAADIRFAALFYKTSENNTQKLCERYRVGNDFRELAVLVAKYFSDYHQVLQYKAPQLLQLLQRVDAFRRPGRFEKFLLACSVHAEDYLAKNILLQNAYGVCANINAQDFIAQGLENQAIAVAMEKARLAALEKLASPKS